MSPFPQGAVYRPWACATKTIDESRSSTIVIADDRDLKFLMLANAEYLFRAFVFWTTPAAADFKHRLLGPVSPSIVSIARKSIEPGSGVIGVVAVDGAYSTSDNAILGTGALPGYLEFGGVIMNGITAGNFRFAWAQNSSNAGITTVLSGSYIEYQRLS